MATTDELRAAYPGAADAVEFHEQPRAAHLWQVVREETAGAGPRVAVECLYLAASLAAFNWPELTNALPQMKHPDFLAYVKAKLGCM